MRLALLSLAGLALAACDNIPTGEPSGPIRSDSEANVVAEESANTATAEAGDLPPPGPGPRFVGNWAADSKSCQSAAWRFTDSLLQTPTGSTCSFNRVTEVDGGYDISATCTAQGPPASDTLRLRFAEGPKSLMIESEVIGDAGLAFCGREA